MHERERKDKNRKEEKRRGLAVPVVPASPSLQALEP